MGYLSLASVHLATSETQLNNMFVEFIFWLSATIYIYGPFQLAHLRTYELSRTFYRNSVRRT